MNQILYTDNNKRGGGPIDIKIILRVLVVCLLIFGVLLIATAGVSLYKNAKGAEIKELPKPIISIENNGDDTITISVKHTKQIKEVSYSWNGENEEVIQGDGLAQIQKVIDIPIGTNNLKVTATDVDGQISQNEGKYVAEEDPKIDISAEESNIKISVEGTNKISYITYRWDEEEETKVEIGDMKAEQLVEIPQGLHTLTIVAVDVNNKTTTKQQDVKAVTKPKLKVTTDGKRFIINASDDEKLEKVEFILNGQGYRLNISDKEFEYSYELEEGENKLEVTVYNSNGLTATFKAKCTRQ